MWILKYNNILNLKGIYTGSFLGIFPHLFLSMWLSWQGLWHTQGVKCWMGYPAHSSPSAWWCQRLIHRFPDWDGTQRQAICSSPQGFGAAADETNLINIDREVGGVPRSGCTVANEVKSREPDKLSLVLVCAPQLSPKRQEKFKRAGRIFWRTD